MGWFEIDKGGLRQLMEGKAKSFILRELAQNAWDEPGVTECKMFLNPVPDKSLAELTVIDDAPEGFHDIRHAFTLFSNTRKRKNAEKRGRFNLGEKQVLSLCESASIETTKGTVVFNRNGERTSSKQKRKAGSVFSGVLRMTRTELSECKQTVMMFLPPREVQTSLNGLTVPYREPLREVEATLTTEHENGDGQWRRTRRKTIVEAHKPSNGENPMIYEMGLPVVELAGGDKYHYNVMQRVPLNSDRDNVSPAFLRDVRAEVMNTVAELLTKEEAAEAWTRDATESDRIEKDAFETVIHKRHGNKVVSFSPTDPEANAQAAAHGYAVLSGGTMSKPEWENSRRFEAVESSSSRFPTPHPEHSNGDANTEVPREKWTPGMKLVVEFIEALGKKLIDGCFVTIVRDKWNRFSGWFSQGGCELTINLQVQGHRFFNEFPVNMEEVLRFAIHEFGHQHVGNHLSEDYYRELCELGARSTVLAAENPRFFRRWQKKAERAKAKALKGTNR